MAVARIDLPDGRSVHVTRKTPGRAVHAAMTQAGRVHGAVVVQGNQRWTYVGCPSASDHACACDGSCWRRVSVP